PKALSDAVCYTQYPFRKGLAGGLNRGSTLTLDLAPWELIFLEIVPRSELGEPVALARIIHDFGDKKNLLWYKHVEMTMFEAPKEAFAWVTISQQSVFCSPIFL